MKIYIVPVSDYELVALAEGNTQPLCTYVRNADVDYNDAVLAVRDIVAAHPGGPHQMLSVTDPDAHPIVRGLLENIQRVIDDAPTNEPKHAHWCTDCAHARVCSLAAEARNFEATVSTCPEYVQLPKEDHGEVE